MASVVYRRGALFSRKAFLIGCVSRTLGGMICEPPRWDIKATYVFSYPGLEATALHLMHLKLVQQCFSLQLRGISTQSSSKPKNKKKKKKRRRSKKKKKKKKRRDVVRKLQKIRELLKVKKRGWTVEKKLIARVERAKIKKAALEEELKKYETPPLPPLKHDPKPLSPEELHYLQRLGYRHKNRLKMGVRGVFGGVILNMHLHWKKHQLVKILCKKFTEEEIKETGEQLARLSGGIVIDVQKGDTIVMYRGRNYTRPLEMTPKHTLARRKALFKAKFEQSLEACVRHLTSAEKELVLYREEMAKRQAERARRGKEVCAWSDDDDEVNPPGLC